MNKVEMEFLAFGVGWIRDTQGVYSESDNVFAIDDPPVVVFIPCSTEHLAMHGWNS